MIRSPFSHPNRIFGSGFYRDADLDFEVRTTLGKVASGAADTGEILSAIAKVDEGDNQAWFEQWTALGERVEKIAEESAAGGHRVSAADAYLRASTYYGVALGSVDRLKSDEPLLPTFRRHRKAWDGFVDTTPVSTERVAIPYEGMTMPGYLFKPIGKDARSCLILVNGSDGTLSGLWGCAKAALARGYAVLMFDGPGQQSLLFEKDVPFRFDWEAVITPVVDYLLQREDVGSHRLAIYGVSQAGYWVPRALAFEHRIAAAVADPGVVDVSTSWVQHLPSGLKKLLAEGNERLFDIEMSLGMKLSGDTSRMWNFRARPYRQDDYFKTIQEVLKYNLTDVAGRIRTPMFITDPEDEQFWLGQAKQLAAMLPGEKTLSPFTAAEGANWHCQPLARTLTEQRIFDWLDDVLARRLSSIASQRGTSPPKPKATLMTIQFQHSDASEPGISIPAIGLVLNVRLPPFASDGAFSIIETINSPGFGPPRHRHREAEIFRVLEGRYLYEVDGRRFYAEVGDVVSIPGGAEHGFINVTDKPARQYILITPALDAAAFFSELGSVMSTGIPDRTVLNSFGAQWGMEFLGPPLKPTDMPS